MNNFKVLLDKIREIMEGEYDDALIPGDIFQSISTLVSDASSDNTELSLATHNLENVVEKIVSKEEQKRTYL